MKTCKQLMQEMYTKEVPDKSVPYKEWENNVYLKIAEKVLAIKKTNISIKKELAKV